MKVPWNVHCWNYLFCLAIPTYESASRWGLDWILSTVHIERMPACIYMQNIDLPYKHVALEELLSDFRTAHGELCIRALIWIFVLVCVCTCARQLGMMLNVLCSFVVQLFCDRSLCLIIFN